MREPTADEVKAIVTEYGAYASRLVAAAGFTDPTPEQHLQALTVTLATRLARLELISEQPGERLEWARLSGNVTPAPQDGADNALPASVVVPGGRLT